VEWYIVAPQGMCFLQLFIGCFEVQLTHQIITFPPPMSESFTLPLNFQNTELELPLELEQFGFAYRFLVVYGQVRIYFERDEQGQFRAFSREGNPNDLEKIPDGLIALIAQKLDELSA